MKRLRAGLLVCVCFPLLLAAADFKVPALTGRVVDQSGTLDGSGKIQIEAAIRNLEEASGGQMVVAFLNSIGDTPIEEVGIALGDAWKIGHKGKDNGAILIVVPADRQIRLEVGYGWEGAVNDARAGDVIRGLQSYFRNNDYAGGAVYAVKKVQEFVKGEAPTGSAPPRKTFSGGKLFFVVLFVVVFLVLGRITRGGGSGGNSRGGGGRGFRCFGGFGRGGGRGGFGGGGGRFGGGGASGRW